MLSKIKNNSKKILKKISRKTEVLPLRITNENVEAHRENVLAGGRKFKYPMQYAKHKLVYNAVIIASLVIAVFGVITWWQLYPLKSTNGFFYRVTKVAQLPVAVIDGELVPYQDYLMKYRSSIFYLENIEKLDLNNEDGKAQMSYFQTQAMHEALMNAYARKVASTKNIKVDKETVDNFLKQQRQSSAGEVSVQTYNAVILDYYDWTSEEYRYAIENILLRQAVAYAVDDEALSISKDFSKSLAGNTASLASIVDSYNKTAPRKVEYVDAGWVPRSNSDGGITEAAAKLSNGQLSDVITPIGGDGYYFIKLVDSNTDQVNFQYIKVTLKTFEDTVTQLEKSDKVQYYISMP
jgi:P2-related tail formation protein